MYYVSAYIVFLFVSSCIFQVLPRTVILAGFKTLHKGLGICMTCGSTKVVRFMHGLLSRLMGMFPTEPGECHLACEQLGGDADGVLPLV